MNTALLVVLAASMMSGQTNSPQACPAQDAPPGAATATPPRFDPLVLDLEGDKAKATPGTCNHAISTKGTGTSGRAGPGGDDCDDTDGNLAASESRSAPRESLASACAAGSTDPDQGCGDAVASTVQSSQSKLAIKCKGTSAK